MLTNVVLLYLFLGGWDFWKIFFYTLFFVVPEACIRLLAG